MRASSGWLAWGLACSVAAPALAQLNPLKLATLGRLDLTASTSAGALRQGVLLEGSGSIDRQTWLPPDTQPRTYYVQFGIARFAWNAYTVQFTPDQDGVVQLELKGPWEEVTAGSGNIYRAEVLYDAVTATGATVVNGSFETLDGSAISGWSGGTTQAGSANIPAVEGARVARAWHNNGLSQTLTVQAGVPVRLRFHARAVVPFGFREMIPIANPESPAHQAARRFMRGVNFGNYLEAPPNTWGTFRYEPHDFALARAEGFDHVRVPVAWHHYTGDAPGYALAPAIFAQTDALVTHALDAGLGVILNLHHYDAFTSNPTALTNQFNAIWTQVAAHYSNYPPALAFELLNEPKDLATTPLLNPIYTYVIRLIRQTNPARTLWVGPGQWNSVTELSLLLLPDEDANLIATVHSYEPFLVTHQGTSWTGADTATRGLVFPGPPATPASPAPGVATWVTNWIETYNTLPTELNPSSRLAFRDRFRLARQWADRFGRPVQVSEFGCYELADAASRAAYVGAVRTVLDELGLGWTLWDWKAAFHYQRDGAPDPPGMRPALFPAPRLDSRGPGAFEWPGAIGKTLVVERALELREPIPWQPLSTQTLAQPHFSFRDATAPQHPAAFYRVQWVK
ncbi:MAG: glycoside hydrolase family 5 protein [Verrucomicrobia bacterium]|nr:glycoside hydrolase family 5 protein [Verrucomicrobiota bacterium]